MSIVAIIPARGGSKRIPGKNIKPFAGRPVIAYSIAAAQQSGVFDRIIVSTDSEEIASVAHHYGAEIPFMRPKELADDYTIADRVVRHALDWLTSGGYSVNYLCWIYPTAPFIRPEHIRQGAELIWAKKVSQVFSVTDFPYPIFRALRITEHGNLSMFWPEHDKTRSQDLPKAYHDAGQFYWVEVERFRRMKCAIAEDAFPVLIPRDLVQDIDTPEDWEIAERMFRARAK